MKVDLNQQDLINLVSSVAPHIDYHHKFKEYGTTCTTNRNSNNWGWYYGLLHQMTEIELYELYLFVKPYQKNY